MDSEVRRLASTRGLKFVTGSSRSERPGQIANEALDLAAVSYTHLTLPTIYSV